MKAFEKFERFRINDRTEQDERVQSTLLNIASGLEKPSAGSVHLDGVDLSGLSREELCNLRRHSLSFIFQSFNLFPVLTAVENVEFTLLIRGDNKKAARQKALESLKLVGLGDRWDHLPTELSGGQQQRVAAARAIIGKPSMILADEPTSALDFNHREKFIKLLFELCNQHQTSVLFVSHDRTLEKLFDRSLSLHEINKASKADEDII